MYDYNEKCFFYHCYGKRCKNALSDYTNYQHLVILQTQLNSECRCLFTKIFSHYNPLPLNYNRKVMPERRNDFSLNNKIGLEPSR